MSELAPNGGFTFNAGVCFSVVPGAPGSGGSFTFPVSLSYQVNQQGLEIVNTWTDTALSTYGLRNIPIANNPGNTLVAVVGWNGASVNPVANVADDAHNWWVHGGTSASGGTCRTSVWVCPNAQAVKNLSVGLSWFTQSVCTVIVELSPGVPWANIDVSVSAFAKHATSLSLPYTNNTPDIMLAAICQSNNTATVQRAAGSFSQIASASINDPSGAGGPADCSVSAWMRTIGSSQSNTPQWTANNPTGLSGVIVGITRTPSNPVQKNPNWPGVHVEMGFGYQPGDPTQLPVWTDVTSRTMGESGASVIQASRGRQYESESPEAGDLKIQLNNQDGAFNPDNTSSPYWPNVLQGTPVRVWATWNGRTYPIAYGYTERIPQEFPDAQWGQVPWEAPDALEPLSNSQLPSALAGELLSDAPYGLWPFSDQYLQDAADGMPFSNLSRTNQRTFTGMDAIYVDSGNINTRYLETGLSWVTTQVGQTPAFEGLAGDTSSSALGCSAFVGFQAGTRTPGAFYTAPDMPQPGTTGVTVEFWAMVTGISAGSNYQELLRVSGPAGNYYVGTGGVAGNAYARGSRFLVRVNPGPAGTQGQDWVYITVSDYEGNSYGTGVQGLVTNNQPHHFAFVITESVGSNYKIQFWLDGQLVSTTFSSGVNVENDWNYIGVGGVMHNDGGLSWGYNYTFGHLALFPAALTNARIQAHYNTAFTGGEDDLAISRWAKLLVWGGFGLPRAGAPSAPNPAFGPADTISGQSVVDAGNTVAQADNGMMFQDAAGNITYWPRTFLLNRSVKWTLGDGTGEIPYQPDEAYDYDNQFLANSVSTQAQVNSYANGPLVVAADQASENQYFTRSGQQNTMETGSLEDAYDQVNWQLQKYKQPKLRVRQVVLDPASNPAVWPCALGIEQGDIVQLNRRPLGAAVYSQTYIVQMISHDTGPDRWQVTLTMVPYDIEGSVLQCDASGNDVVGSNGIGW